MARHNDGVHAGSVGRPHAGAEVVRVLYSIESQQQH
jgi:hypothetical protein